MDGIKPWQLAIIIIGLVGGIGLVGWNLFSGQRIQQADSVVMVDVNTGALFEFSVKGSKSVLIPAKNPETGERTLLPVDKAEGGGWMIAARYMHAMSRYKPEERTSIDAQGRVTGDSDKIKRVP
jgi:hypothetical protein